MLVFITITLFQMSELWLRGLRDHSQGHRQGRWSWPHPTPTPSSAALMSGCLVDGGHSGDQLILVSSGLCGFRIKSYVPGNSLWSKPGPLATAAMTDKWDKGTGGGMDEDFDMRSWALREQAWPLLQYQVRAEAQIWGPPKENWGAPGT